MATTITPLCSLKVNGYYFTTDGSTLTRLAANNAMCVPNTFILMPMEPFNPLNEHPKDLAKLENKNHSRYSIT